MQLISILFMPIPYCLCSDALFLKKSKASVMHSSFHKQVLPLNAAHIFKSVYRQRHGVKVQSTPALIVVFMRFVATLVAILYLNGIIGPHNRKVAETYRD